MTVKEGDINLLIQSPEIIEKADVAILQSIIEYGGKQEKLWYSVDRKYGQYLTSEKLDAFVVGILPLAMELGEDITVKGSISEKLYHNLTNYYINIAHIAIPSRKVIKIIPDSLDDGKNYGCEGAVGTGFSGGIDSFFTILQYLVAKDVPPHYKITHLVFSNVGAQGAFASVRMSNGSLDFERARKLFNFKYELLKGLPEEMGVDFVKIDSNLSDVLNMRYQTSYQSRTLSCPLLLQKLFSKYYFASGYSYHDTWIKETPDLTHTDPASVHLLSTETLECISSGAQFTRVEKTKLLAQSGIADKLLNVCNDTTAQGKNCSICQKCCRTLITLELLGVIDKFDGVFDLKKWRKHRNPYIVSNVLRKGQDGLGPEIKEYADKIGYSFPVWQRLMAREPFYSLARIGYKAANKLTRK
jgi:hypothetical protein